MRIQAAIATAAILTFAAGAANADAQKYVAHLTAAAEVPPTTTAAKGDIAALLDNPLYWPAVSTSTTGGSGLPG